MSFIPNAEALGYCHLSLWDRVGATSRCAGVAQICNLLYRRFVIGKVWGARFAGRFKHTPQNAILRYSRLKICATRWRIVWLPGQAQNAGVAFLHGQVQARSAPDKIAGHRIMHLAAIAGVQGIRAIL